MENSTRKQIINIIGVVIMFTAFVFIIKSFLSFDVDWRNLLSLRYVFYILISTVVIILALVLNTYCWYSMMSFFSGKEVDFKAALNVYTNSNLGKYLPGNVGHYAGRQFFGASLGLKQSHLVLASILEVTYNAAAALLLSVVLAWEKILELIEELFPQLNSILFIFIGICVSIMFIILLYFIFRKKDYFIELISLIKTFRFWLLFLKGVLISAVSLLLFGIMFALLISVSVPLDYDSFEIIVAASVTSWLIGFITPGVPGGVGVRESVLIVMLSSVCTNEIALVAGVFQRISSVSGDILIWLISKILLKNGKHHKFL